MTIGFFFLLIGNAASFLGARVLAARVRTGDDALDFVVLLLFRLLLISGAVLLAGLAQGLSVWGLGLASTAALAALLACGAHRGLRRPSWPWILATVVALRLLLQVWCFAPHLGDALAYHLPKIAEWVRAGGFTRELGLHPHGSFPAGFELVEAWWVVFLHHDVLIEAAGLEFVLLAFAAVRSLGRRLGFDARTADLAALIFALTPGFHLSATSCLNDAAAAAYVLVLAALVFGRAPLGVIGMAAALGLGTKATVGYAFPGLLLLAFLVRKEPRPAASRGTWAAALGAAVGGFWYVRNLLWYGNPVFPVGEPGYALDPVAVQVGPRWSSFLANLRDLLGERIFDQQTALGANVDDMAGWGPLVVACGGVALVSALPRDRGLRRLAAAFAVSLLSSLLFIVHDPWCLKYVFYVPAIGALAVAPRLREVGNVRTVAATALLCTFLLGFLPYDLPFPQLRTLVGQGWRERSALAAPEAARSADVVACFGGFQAKSYLLYRPDFSRRVVYLRSKTFESFLSDLAGSGATIAYAKPVGSVQQSLLDEALRRGALESLGDSFYRISR